MAVHVIVTWTVEYLFYRFHASLVIIVYMRDKHFILLSLKVHRLNSVISEDREVNLF
jgi:hypothetical protein